MELILLHDFTQINFGLVNLLLAGETTADGTLFSLTVIVLVDPVLLTALSAIEFGALFAVVTDVLEIEFGTTALGSLAPVSRKSFLNQFASLRVSG